LLDGRHDPQELQLALAHFPVDVDSLLQIRRQAGELLLHGLLQGRLHAVKPVRGVAPGGMLRAGIRQTTGLLLVRVIVTK
jgi:hypothetical protein